ncbi:YiiD C-terminal domain-containing protein [Allohahella marinimesophila]|uniref:YiiD C-terminal domain-containing protein n=2 Tax=Allohahella marinimesophila TaxID=1054972 RepID=A0ABP7NJR6_9GAMM
MDKAAIVDYLHTHIPISQAMGVEVLEQSETAITLSAPFPPNINHQGTVFGGSIASVATLAAWTMIYVRLKAEKLEGDLVVQRSNLEYLLPMRDAFTARCELDEQAWQRFLGMFRRRHKGRLHMLSEVHCAQVLTCRLEGDFVVTAA